MKEVLAALVGVGEGPRLRARGAGGDDRDEGDDEGEEQRGGPRRGRWGGPRC
jgi:hypothetical protein